MINDFKEDRKSLIVLDDNDFERIERVWHNEDTLLRALQETSIFIGKTRWSHLDPTHWRVMIIQNLTRVAALSDEECQSGENATIESLHFLISGLIFCIQQRTESIIELLHINRIDDVKVTYDYTASLNMAIVLPQPPQPGLRVVIDNSEEI